MNWKNIDRCIGYQISSTGDVMSPNKILGQSVDKHGYKFIQIFRKNKKVSVSITRMELRQITE